MLQQNEALARVTALARKSGVVSSFDDIRSSVTDAAISQHRTAIVAPSRSADEHVRDLVFNSAVREIFLHYFVQVCSAQLCAHLHEKILIFELIDVGSVFLCVLACYVSFATNTEKVIRFVECKLVKFYILGNKM